jgi:uncharacterized protein DUF5683
MYKCLFLVWFIIGFALAAQAQKPKTDTLKNRADSITKKRDSVTSKPFKPKITKERSYHPDSLHSPHKAVIRSLIIPGWGQLYNGHWWKVPVIYAGLGTLGYAYFFNEHYYSLLLKEDILREHGVQAGRNPDFVGVSDSDIDNATNLYRRDRDLCILGTLGAWGIQAVDAYVAAKFKHSYTMDNNLSIRIRPGFIDQPQYAFNNYSSYIPGVKITFILK